MYLKIILKYSENKQTIYTTHTDADDISHGYDISHNSEVVMTAGLLDQL